MLVPLLLLTAGAVAAARAAIRRRTRVSWAALATGFALARGGQRGASTAAAVAGIATLAWPAAGITLGVELADQVLIGPAWVALGELVRRAPSRRRPTPPRW